MNAKLNFPGGETVIQAPTNESLITQARCWTVEARMSIIGAEWQIDHSVDGDRMVGLEEHAKNCEGAKDLNAAAAAAYAANAANAAYAAYAAAAAAAAANAANAYAADAADAILILATKIANEALEQCLAEAAA